MKSKIINNKYTIILLMILSSFTKVFGFLREIYLAKYFGASNITDSYKIVMQIPTIILAFIGVGISTGFIPIYNSIIAESNEEDANDFMSNILNISLLIVIIFVFLVQINPAFFIKVFAYGFSNDERLTIAVEMLRVSIFSSLFSAILFCLPPFLQIHRRFNPTVLMTIPMNVIFIISYPIAKVFGVKYLSIGIVLAILSQVIFLVPYVLKENYKWRPNFQFKDKNVLKLIKLAMPVTFGVAVQQINNLIDKNMASSISMGGVSILDYALKLVGFVVTIVIFSFVTVVYPELSKLHIDNKKSEFDKSFFSSFTQLNLIVLPATFGLISLSNPIIKVIYQRGSFGDTETLTTSVVMMFYAISLPGIGIRELVSRAFYSINDTKTPTRNSIISVCLNILLNLILSRYIGLNGLALATSLSLIICSILLIISFLKKGYLKNYKKEMAIVFSKIILISSLMGFLCNKVYTILRNNQSIHVSLLGSIVFGALFYFICISLVNINEVNEIKNDLIIRFRR